MASVNCRATGFQPIICNLVHSSVLHYVFSRVSAAHLQALKFYGPLGHLMKCTVSHGTGFHFTIISFKIAEDLCLFVHWLACPNAKIQGKVLVSAVVFSKLT